MSRKQAAFLFGEGKEKTLAAEVRGGKGRGLAEMAAMGLPVPPGFTITTSVARALAQSGGLPRRLPWQINRCLAALERETGKVFGSAENPLLVSVRSGAASSMPGMMDTILNLGLNPQTVEGLSKRSGEQVAFDCYRRFLAQFGETALGIKRERFMFPNGELAVPALRELCEKYRTVIAERTGHPVQDDPMQQLAAAIFAVFHSWNSERAIAYRNAQGIPHWRGTAVNVQAMVFGNHGDDSCTGVVFSRNVATGEPGLYGEFLPNAQGEDVVSGIRTPLPIAEMRSWNERLYRELIECVQALEGHYGDVVDVEFTVERGRLYILQSRVAKRTPEAAAVCAVRRVWEKSIPRKEALKLVNSVQAELLRRPVFDPEAVTGATVIASGTAASPGAAVGKAAFSSAKAQELAAEGQKAVLVRKDTSPDDLPGMLVSVAIVTEVGGGTSHAAVVARGLGLPAVVGTAKALEVVEGELLSVDGSTGRVFRGALPLAGGSERKEVKIFLRWLDGGVKVPAWPTPRVDFAWVDKKTNANQLLADFYLTDAMAQASVRSPLASAAEALRRKVHTQAAEMLTCYLAIAVAGELRHSSNKARLDESARRELEALAWEFKLEQGGDRLQVQMKTVEALRSNPRRLSQFFQSAVEIFSANWSSSFGGKAWAKIAQAPLDFLNGRVAHSVFVDHVFDLRHNGGRIFGKHGMLTEDGCIELQLDAKKTAKNTPELRKGLAHSCSCPCGQCRPSLTFSPEVEDVFSKGEKQGLW